MRIEIGLNQAYKFFEESPSDNERLVILLGNGNGAGSENNRIHTELDKFTAENIRIITIGFYPNGSVDEVLLKQIEEIVLIFVFGCIIMFIFSTIHLLTVFFSMIILSLIVAYLRISEKIPVVFHSLEIRCPECKQKFDEPNYRCPNCGQIHEILSPGFYGVFNDICKGEKNRKRNKQPIKNRKNKQKRYYSGKKKRHTLKTQVVVDRKCFL